MNTSKRVLLARYPSGLPVAADFALDEVPLAEPAEGEFLIRNLYFSLDAGFRQWMREGAGDNYLSAMQIGEPVMSLTLGRVERSRHPDFEEGILVLGRHAWETFTLPMPVTSPRRWKWIRIYRCISTWGPLDPPV